ncbi:MAG: hypothetical protein QM760_14065 [Nibricoccus sp.]
MSPYDIVSYSILVIGCVYFGRKLYGGWAPGICLAFVSPLVFGIVAGFLVTLELGVVDIVRSLFGLPKVTAKNDVIIGLCQVMSSIAAVGGLAWIAKKEGVKQKSATEKASVSPK